MCLNICHKRRVTHAYLVGHSSQQIRQPEYSKWNKFGRRETGQSPGIKGISYVPYAPVQVSELYGLF